MDDRLRHTSEEAAAGREALAELRARFRRARLGDAPAGPERGKGREAESSRLEAEIGLSSEADRFAIEMAWGAERERLEGRIEELESEVAALRRALGQVLRAAATAVEPPSD